jgi:hypothetical protein
MQGALPRPAPTTLQLGRPFIGSAFDLLLIGGGLTFPLCLWLWRDGASVAAFAGLSAPLLVLLCNQAHFAASTVRLYTKPGAFQSFPFLTMVFPLVTLAVLSVCILWAGRLGSHLWDLYVAWSPFHYAAQTFGLSSMYCYRSGCPLGEGERRALRLACLLPFFFAFLAAAPSGHGLGWLVPSSALASGWVRYAFATSLDVLRVLIFLLPLGLYLWLAYRARSAPPGETRRGMPLISLSLLVTNGIWWAVFNYIDAFLWATIFHGLQYLAIVSVFHVRERVAQPEDRHGWLFHTATFYAMCLGLGYLLFQCWPYAYVVLGYGRVESILLVAAVINLHHFIVDGFIWRIRRDARNRAVMAQG